MKVEDAIPLVQEKFPIRQYLRAEDGSYQQVARTVLRYLNPGATILDFGSGPCDKTGVLQVLGYRCSAYDDLQDEWHKVEGIREQILGFAAGLGIDFRMATGGALPFESESFDMVMAHHVLEHFHNSPRELLNELVRLIKPGGYLFITVPNAVNIRKRLFVIMGKTNMMNFDYYYWCPGPWRGHVREYTRGDLASLAAHLGIEMVELRGVDHMLSRLPGPLRPVYRGATMAFPGFKDTWSLVARKPQGWVPANEVPPERLEHVYRASRSRCE
jgi:2-polyprenyl-3-methyl-5-hydroxy-6-metoxy-1,4-benzoquinol methylase